MAFNNGMRKYLEYASMRKQDTNVKKSKKFTRHIECDYIYLKNIYVHTYEDS